MLLAVQAEPEFQTLIANIQELEADFGAAELEAAEKVNENLMGIHNTYIFEH